MGMPPMALNKGTKRASKAGKHFNVCEMVLVARHSFGL